MLVNVVTRLAVAPGATSVALPALMSVASRRPSPALKKRNPTYAAIAISAIRSAP
jgi:hypothetical protein